MLTRYAYHLLLCVSNKTKPLIKKVSNPDQVCHCGLGVPVTEIFEACGCKGCTTVFLLRPYFSTIPLQFSSSCSVWQFLLQGMSEAYKVNHSSQDATVTASFCANPDNQGLVAHTLLTRFWIVFLLEMLELEQFLSNILIYLCLHALIQITWNHSKLQQKLSMFNIKVILKYLQHIYWK